MMDESEICPTPLAIPMSQRDNLSGIGQWAERFGFARRSRSNQSLIPVVRWTIRLNLRRAQGP